MAFARERGEARARTAHPRADDLTIGSIAHRRAPLRALTGLRIIAALSVVAYHFSISGRSVLPPLAFRPLSLGFLGVDVFFVLSGFILVYNYYGERTSLGAFYWARFIRIYPTYLLALLISLALTVMLGESSGTSTLHGGTQFLVEAGLVQSWVPGAACGFNCPDWSVSVETFFYVLFPFLLLVMERWSGAALVTLAALLWALTLLPAIYILQLEHTLDGHAVARMVEFFVFHPLTNTSQFFTGTVAGTLFLRRGRLGVSDFARLGWLVAGAFAAGLLWVELAPPSSESLLRAGLFSPIFAGLIYLLAQQRGWLAHILSLAPIVVLGEASYAVYLYQTPVNRALVPVVRSMAHADSMLLVGLASLAALLGMSVLSFLYFERPLRVWLKAAIASPHARPSR